MLQEQLNFDLIVIGGGPGGSTLASLVAMRGHKVLLLEREHFPRHQIGESLLPSTVHGICKLLGVHEELAQAGFPRKLGASFRWGKNPNVWRFEFGSHPALAAAGATFAYQVERSRFDKILLDNSRRKGVDVREGQTVIELLKEGERFSGVRFKDEAGNVFTAQSRFVADASGQQSQTCHMVGERIYSKYFQNVALYGYFEGGRRLPPPNSGNILCAAFSDGWFWYIPLSDTLTSVGAVISKDNTGQLKLGYEQAMTNLIDKCPLIKEYLGDAKRVTTGQYGTLRVRKDYSYLNSRFWAPGCVLIGDAACFIDPVFSSGVHLSTYSALLAARSINTCLEPDQPLSEEQLFTEFEKRYREEFSMFYKFYLTFYDMNQDESSYYWAARKITEHTAPDDHALVRLVSGGASSPTEFFKPLVGSGAQVDQALVWIDDTARSFVEPEAPVQSGYTDIFGGLLKYAPTPGSLTTTPDGLQWQQPASP
jgi:halogenation protein CepH